MSAETIKKTFDAMGTIEYKVASSREEIESAMALVYKEYLMRGFIRQEDYKSKLRVTLNHMLPSTTTFIGLKDNETVITDSIMPDSPLGLPMDMGYKEEADKLRKAGRSICEVGYLAIKTELFGRGHFSMFNFQKLDFMFTIFKLVYQYLVFHTNIDDIVIVTNPSYMIFKFLPFEVIGKVKYYGYDHASIKKKPAIAKRADIKHMRENIDLPNIIFGTRVALFKMFLGSRIPEAIFKNRYNFTLEDLHYFGVEKSEVLAKATKEEQDYICACYNLTGEEFQQLLKGKLPQR